MRRRDFLYQSAFLAPVLALAPSRVLANHTSLQVSAILIQNPDMAGAQRVKDTLHARSSELITVNAAQVSTIRRSVTGFHLELADGRRLQTSKLVLDLHHAVRPDEATVSFEAENRKQKISFKRKGESIPPPEFWSLRAGSYLADDMEAFIKRKKPAFACISHP